MGWAGLGLSFSRNNRTPTVFVLFLSANSTAHTVGRWRRTRDALSGQSHDVRPQHVHPLLESIKTLGHFVERKTARSFVGRHQKSNDWLGTSWSIRSRLPHATFGALYALSSDQRSVPTLASTRWRLRCSVFDFDLGGLGRAFCVATPNLRSSGAMRPHESSRAATLFEPGRLVLPVPYTSAVTLSPFARQASPTKLCRSKWLSLVCAAANASQSTDVPRVDAATMLMIYEEHGRGKHRCD